MLAFASSCLPLQTSPWGRLSRFAPRPAAHLSAHNGSKTRNSVPLRNPPAGCTASTGLLKQDGLSSPSHNGSKSRNSVPLRNPRPAASFFTALQETLPVTKKNCSHGAVLEQNDNQCVNAMCCGSDKFKNGRKHAAVRLRIECQTVAKKKVCAHVKQRVKQVAV